MATRSAPEFTTFAGAFVRAYWETFRSGRFPMPPDEPVDESLDELLSSVAHTTQRDCTAGPSSPTHILHMTSDSGGWWLFRFREGASGWTLAGCVAPSNDPAEPHDLLAPPYATYFRPFLQHVVAVAHERMNT